MTIVLQSITSILCTRPDIMMTINSIIKTVENEWTEKSQYA